MRLDVRIRRRALATATETLATEILRFVFARAVDVAAEPLRHTETALHKGRRQRRRRRKTQRRGRS